jgi:hypothetical protein
MKHAIGFSQVLLEVHIIAKPEAVNRNLRPDCRLEKCRRILLKPLVIKRLPKV